jgi:hypothetical protein
VNTFPRNNWTSIARQRISKYASLKDAVFSAWSVQSSYKEMFGSIEQYRIESSLRNWQLQNTGKKGIMLRKENFLCDLN